MSGHLPRSKPSEEVADDTDDEEEEETPVYSTAKTSFYTKVSLELI